ncbi:uncharacterized protein [Henckelia pumila]|uniref:uncharacterized protein n=1 Tax=Henckelia pumila TaxID=405737 RepID=UPI003C6E2919
MAAADEKVQFSLNVVAIKESSKVLYAQVDSDFADVLLSFLTLPLGTIVRLLIKHYGDNVPVLGSLNSLYAGLLNMDTRHFWTEAGKLMLLNPRNSSQVQCSRLKLQIETTPPIQHFVCGNWTCVSTYNNVKCLCRDPRNTMTRVDLEVEAQSRDNSIFTLQTASFLLTDDLQILANTSASIFQILKQNGIEDTGVLVEKTLIFWLKEIMELLKHSLVSKTPVTDTVRCNISPAPTLRKRKRPVASSTSAPAPAPAPDALPETQASKHSSSGSKRITVKALVQKSTNRILFAQAWQDFIDFLFSLLAIPLGTVQFLLGSNNCLGSINNLYRSISNLESMKYMKNREIISRLLEPQIPPHYLSSYQIFSLSQQTFQTLHRYYDISTFKLSSSPPSHRREYPMKVIDPKGRDSFVKGPAMFTVTDDLLVVTPPSTSIISTLNQMKVSVSDVEEREIDIGMAEALSILKASLTSTCALTEGLKPFLKRPSMKTVPKQEKL